MTYLSQLVIPAGPRGMHLALAAAQLAQARCVPEWTKFTRDPVGELIATRLGTFEERDPAKLRGGRLVISPQRETLWWSGIFLKRKFPGGGPEHFTTMSTGSNIAYSHPVLSRCKLDLVIYYKASRQQNCQDSSSHD